MLLPEHTLPLPGVGWQAQCLLRLEIHYLGRNTHLAMKYILDPLHYYNRLVGHMLRSGRIRFPEPNCRH
jgi:hypothetical protein